MRSSKKYIPKGDFENTYMWKVSKGIYMIQTENLSYEFHSE